MLKLARHVTLRQLQIFEAIGRLKNFTRVAEELFLTQSTVSTQVKHLSELAGMPLVEIVGKKTYLTEAGEILYHACQDVINRLDNAEMAFADLKGIKIGSLKLSVISTAKYFAPEVLGKFWQQYPDIEVSLNVNNKENILQRLDNNEDDLYILGHNPPKELDIETIEFAANPIYVMASKKHPLIKQKQKISLKQFAEQSLILREPGSGIRDVIESMFKSKGLKPNVRMVLSNNEAIKHALIGQLGISVLSLHTILLEGAKGPIALLNVEGFPVHRKWHLVYRKGKELSVIAKSFVDFLHNEGERLTQQVNDLAQKIDPQLK
ncbi:MAG: LysR family transcriptional regulator [Gammaproteobacteria bacterium]|jgi:DNA-binding transcriptional LysR family regulator